MKCCDVILWGVLEMRRLKAYHTYNIAALGRIKFGLLEDRTWGGKENARPADLDMPLEEEEVDEEGDKEFTSLEGAFGLEGSGQQKSIHETQAPAKKSCDK